MRKLNLPWLFGLILGSIGIAILGFGLHEIQMWRNAPSFLRQAKRAQAENRPRDAAEYLRRYVKLAPNDNEALILYGFQLADLNNAPGALLALEKAIQRQPDRTDVRRRIVNLAIQLRRFSEAADHLQNYLLKESPKDIELLDQLSTCQIAHGNFNEAEDTLVSAIEVAPERLDSYLKLASLQQEKRDLPNEALNSINQMVTNNSENYLGYLIRGQWLIQHLKPLTADIKAGRVQGVQSGDDLRKIAGADAEKALELANDNADAIAFAALFAQEFGNKDRVRELAQRGLDLFPSDSRFYTILAELESSSGNQVNAVDLLRRGTLAAPKNLGLKWTFANALIDQGNYTEANEVISQLQTGKYPEALNGFLESKIKFRRQEWIAAIQQLEEIRSALGNSPGLQRQVELWLGIAYRETSSPDQQLISLRRAVDLDPNWPPARIALADSLVSTGKFDEAIDQYKQLTLSPETRTAAQLGRAKAMLLKNLRKPSSPQRSKELDDVLKLLDEINDIAKRYDDTEKQNLQRISLETQVAILRMDTLVAKDNRKQAAIDIGKVREKYPDQIELWNAQIGLAVSSREGDRVEQLFKEIEKQFGDTRAVRLIKGRAFVLLCLVQNRDQLSKPETSDQQEKKTEASNFLRKLAEPLKASSEQERIEYAADFAPLFQSIGDFDEAARLATLVSKAEPTNLRARMLLLDIGLKDKRANLLKDTLNEIKQITGETAIFNYASAVQLTLEETETKDFSKALELLAKAKSERPNWDRIPLLAAEIYERQNDFHAALQQFLEAIRLGVRTSVVTGRAISLLMKEQRFEEAEKLLLKLSESQETFTKEMARTEISLSLRLGHEDQALKSIEKLDQDLQQELDPLWLGQVYATLKIYKKAEIEFRRAIAANNKDPKPWVNLVQTLMRSSERAKAESVIEEAKQAIAPDQLMLALGQCYVFLGKLDLANQSYEAALNQSPDDMTVVRTWIDFLLLKGSAVDAENFVRKSLDGIKGNSDNDKANRIWFNRRLASALAAQGGHDNFNRALDVLNKNLQEVNPQASEDLRIKANILSRSPSKVQRREAAAILEGLLAQKDEFASEAEDSFLLSRLYSTIDEPGKSRTQLRQLTTAHKNDIRYLATYIQTCLQTGELRDAEIYLGLLQKLIPANAITRNLQVQLLFKQLKYSEVAKFLKDIGSAPQKLESSEDRNLWVARRFEEFARLLAQSDKKEMTASYTSEAESFYTKYTQDHPADFLVLAEFLAKTNQVDRSLNLLDEHGAKASVGQVMAVALAIRKNLQATDSQLMRLQNLLKQNIQSRDNSIALSLIAADLMHWRGDYAGSIQVYKDVIARDSRNVAAPNNLAVLLATNGKDLDQAMHLVETAIANGGPLDALIDTRGLVYLAKGNLENALADFKQAIFENESAERLFHEAVALAQSDKIAEAQKSLDRADGLGLSEKEMHLAERQMLKDLREKLIKKAAPK